MGITLEWFDFGAAVPPTRAELDAFMTSMGSGTRGLEAYRVTHRRVELACLFDFVTASYARAFLAARGGVRVDDQGRPCPWGADPWFVTRPWRSLSWWQRFRIEVGSQASMWRNRGPTW
jgi:hypothetical protein